MSPASVTSPTAAPAANLNGGAGQFGDTTYTKVFVGGLAWETQKETMKKYFEQFGDILEAVVISDKATGRSKGYGFVTFREAEAAMRACVDAAPLIDGRRANCNLASLGVQRSKPSTPKHGGGAGGRSFRVMAGSIFQGAAGGIGVGSGFAAAASAATSFPAHYRYAAIQQGVPAATAASYNLYATAGYSPYSPDYTYPTNYYGMYGGGATNQYSIYGAGGGMMTGGAANAAAFYPYLQYGEAAANGGAYTASTAQNVGYGGMHYPHHPHNLYQYSAAAGLGGYHQHYAPSMSLAPSPPVCFAVPKA